MSDTAQRSPAVAGGPPGEPAAQNGAWGRLRKAGMYVLQQREATVFLVVVLLIVYFGFVNNIGRSTFFTKIDLINVSQIAAPIIIIALGEVLLLICGEIDLSAGFTYAFIPFVMHFLIDDYGFPAIPGILVALVCAAAIGWVNGFLTVTIGLPSFVTTLGTGFVLAGLILTLGHGTQAPIPPKAIGIGHWLGTYAWAEITWAVVLTAVFHIVLRRTKWGLHTISVGGNRLGAAEAGVNVSRIRYGNFMLCALLAGFVGIQIAFQTSIIDTFSGGAGYQAMFYAVSAAVIGGTAMLGGSGTMIGAFLGALVLAVLIDGFSVIGVSAYPLQIFFGAAILIAMVLNVTFARLRGQGKVKSG